MGKALILLVMLLTCVIGCEPMPSITDGSLPNIEDAKKIYPKNLSWASIDTDGDGIRENYITPIKAQPCTDCFVYGAVGLLEIQYKIDHKFIASLDLSEQNAHNCLRISCGAAGDDRIVLSYMRDYGVVEERYSTTGDWSKCKNCNNHIKTEQGYTSISEIPFFRFKKWRYVTVPDMPYESKRVALVAALQDGPVGVSTSGWNGFRTVGDIKYCTDFSSGGHVVIVVGYINHGEAFLVKNSHGEPGIIKMMFAGGDRCSFARISVQIIAGSTYTSWGSGEYYCYSDHDHDKDLVPDVHDNCPWEKNPRQGDRDGDSYGDVCDECPEDKGPPGFECSKIEEASLIFQSGTSCKEKVWEFIL